MKYDIEHTNINDYLLQWAMCCSRGLPILVFFSGLTPDKLVHSPMFDNDWINQWLSNVILSGSSWCWREVVAKVGYIVVLCGPK